MGNRADVVQPKDQPTLELEIRDATEEDAIDMAPHLRQADRNEIAAHSGARPIDALCHGVRMSDRPKVVLYRDKPAAIFGLVSLRGVDDALGWPKGSPALDGAVWLLGTDQVQVFSRQFLRWSRQWLAETSVGYSCVGNMVDLRNYVHVRWIEWLGFKFIDNITYGPEGRTFLRFYKEVDSV